jgi:TonB family protein
MILTSDVLIGVKAGARRAKEVDMQKGSGANYVFSRRSCSLLPAAFLLVATCNPNAGYSSTPTTKTEGMPRTSATVTKAGDLRPRIISWPDLERLYPKGAKSRGTEGLVRIAVTLDKQGQATDTQILSVTPVDMGFGAAASTAVHFMTFSNPTGHRTTIKFAVKFALKRLKPRHHHVHPR